MCSKGARAFCLRHGIDWRQLLTIGLDEGQLVATGDAMALLVVEVARERRGR
jgi:hypothetical protein